MIASYATIHRLAVRETTRAELARALHEIESARFVVVGRRDTNASYCYGSARQCAEFADGLERDVAVERMTAERKEQLAASKVRAYRCG